MNGGNGSFTVNTNSACGWTASSNAASWLTITGGSSGTGTGTVSYSVGNNSNFPNPPRSGAITAASNVFWVTQDGVPCQQACSSQSQSIIEQMEAACPGYCTQWVLSTYPDECGIQALGVCFDALDNCVANCKYDASQAGSSHYKQCMSYCQ
jgi:hypothetical protein